MKIYAVELLSRVDFTLSCPQAVSFFVGRATGEYIMTKSHLFLGAAAFAVAIFVSQPVFAQGANTDTVGCLDTNDDGVCDSTAESDDRGTIVVTGRRAFVFPIWSRSSRPQRLTTASFASAILPTSLTR